VVQRHGLARARGQDRDEAELLERLQAGDEEAFVALTRQHHQGMVRLARSYVPSHSVAEDVVQETWLAALRGLPSFEGRSSVKTWLYAILLNQARMAGLKERRHIPIEDPEGAVARTRFNRDGSWSYPPVHWVDEVEDRVRAERLTKSIQVAIEQLPTAQRDVLTLRDMEGLTAADACQVLGLGQGHQRVLLHRARSRLRNALEAEFGQDGA
jgi:RNA polymerase sigma-70 factor, ECF subfamily